MLYSCLALSLILSFGLTFFLNETLVIFIIFPNKRIILRRQLNFKLQFFWIRCVWCSYKCLSPHVVGLQQDVVCGQRRHLTALHGQDSPLQEGFLCTQNNKKNLKWAVRKSQIRKYADLNYLLDLRTFRKICDTLRICNLRNQSFS
jgi:hypothetical protein